MGKTNFLNQFYEYIDTLKAGVIYTLEDWKNIIKNDCEEHGENLEDIEIGWIINELDVIGLVK